MTSALPFTPTTRSSLTDQYYAVIGRALTLATSFENSVKALALLLNIKTSTQILFTTPNKYEEIIDKCYRKTTLFKNLNETCKKLGVSENFKTILDDARIKRNFIAHQLAIPLNEDDEKLLQLYLKEIEDAATCVANADILISTLANLITNQPTLRPDVVPAIKDSIVAWVCEIK